MEINISNVVTFFITIVIMGWLWRIINWLWLRPKRLEHYLRKQGFQGNPYKFFHGNTKDISSMIKENNSKSIECLSNDYIHRITPFQCKTIQKYGENPFMWEGSNPTIVVTKAELIRKIFNRVFDFQKTTPNHYIEEVTKGLARLEGHKWAQERKLINPVFHLEKLKHLVPEFYSSFKDMIQEWEKKTSITGSQEIEMWSDLQKVTADAISRTAFGSTFQEGRRVFELLQEYIVIIARSLHSVYIPGSRYLPTKTNKRAKNIIKEMETILEDLILKRQKSMSAGEKVKDDLLGHLLTSSIEGIQGNGKQLNIKLSLKQVIEECKVFYIAGQETTSALLAWTLILLSKHKNWQEQAREEILSTFGNNTPDYDGLNRLKKVHMVLQEVLRLYPAAPILNRKVSHDIIIDGKVLPAGVQLQAQILLVQQDERFWGSDAKEFNPGRFSEGILKAAGGNICFFSFGWGPRVCIGSNFAFVEAKLGLSMILQRFRLDLSPSYAHAPTTSHGTLRPEFGVNLVLHRL
ncbi:cytochrome P450 CYP72A219-like [Silene latifolia]|uniref:cytochrome P450 CYP72A219-like n=1 Tax=Silene latifolia TaxID=37657 RepID=UPI003D774594